MALQVGFAMVAAYLLGSIPSGVLIARRFRGRDIRELGDGNTGARNVTHVLGWGAGILTAGMDFAKGALAVLLAVRINLPEGFQMAAGVCAVLGHDFPLFAHFRGGQGMATILGVLMALMPAATLLGLAIFALIYAITRKFDLSAGLGLGTLAATAYITEPSWLGAGYAAVMFLTIPVKKWLDRPRAAQAARLAEMENESHSNRWGKKTLY